MKKYLQLIILILIFLKNLIFKKEKYKLKFIAKINENNQKKEWYFKFNVFDLEARTEGLDNFLNAYFNDKNEINILIITSKIIQPQLKNEYYELIGEPLKKKPNTIELDKYAYGRKYNLIQQNKEIIKLYVCPLTLFIIGHYPNYAYVKNITNDK